MFYLDKSIPPVRLLLPTCNPPKASHHTLQPSRSNLGLAQLSHLIRLDGFNLLERLVKEKLIIDKIWSISLLDSERGILSLGTTIAKDMERAKTRSDIELERAGDPTASEQMTEEEVERKLRSMMPDDQPLQAHFKWADTKGAAGWWTSLMAGVWINGVKVLKNQPVLFDVQSPFILAPHFAATRFYEAVGGSVPLSVPFDSFFAVPCQKQINIAFELGGWSFPVMSGEGIGADAFYGPSGGRFSLGRLGNGTGYCLGSVVETQMGERRQWSSSGLQDTWILGEPFFRGLGVVFDLENGKIGFRSY
jgi:hypothetical protein